MKKLWISLFLLINSTFSFSQIELKKETTIGFRTGVLYNHLPDHYKQYNAFVSGANYLKRNFTRFHNQIFINTTIGKNRKSMLELALGYSGYQTSHNNVDSLQNINKSTFSEKVFSPSFTYRYQIARSQKLKWTHYVGTFLHVDIVSDRYKVNYFNLQSSPSNIQMNSNLYRKNYYGLEYFGKIEGFKKWSIQYTLNGSFQKDYLDFRFEILGKPPEGITRTRLNANIGLGYRL